MIGKLAESTGTVMEFPEVSGFGAKGKGQGSLVCLFHTKGLLEVGTQAGGQGPCKGSREWSSHGVDPRATDLRGHWWHSEERKHGLRKRIGCPP